MFHIISKRKCNNYSLRECLLTHARENIINKDLRYKELFFIYIIQHSKELLDIWIYSKQL